MAPHVSVTEHAADRYRERVRPDLTRAAARRELRNRVVEGPAPVAELPASWRQPVIGRNRKRYVLIGERVAAVVRDRGWTQIVLSVLVKPRNRQLVEAFQRASSLSHVD